MDEPRPDAEAGTDSMVGALFKMVLVLGLVLALVYLSLNFGLRKLMRLSPARSSLVKVHERIPLDAKKIVYLVEASGEYLLLGSGERDVSLLARLDPERTKALLAQKAEPAGPRPLAGKPFWERLLVKPPPKGQSHGEADSDGKGGAGGAQPTS